MTDTLMYYPRSLLADENEIEIVRQQGLRPIVACAAMVAEAIDNEINGETCLMYMSHRQCSGDMKTSRVFVGSPGSSD